MESEIDLIIKVRLRIIVLLLTVLLLVGCKNYIVGENLQIPSTRTESEKSLFMNVGDPFFYDTQEGQKILTLINVSANGDVLLSIQDRLFLEQSGIRIAWGVSIKNQATYYGLQGSAAELSIESHRSGDVSSVENLYFLNVGDSVIIDTPQGQRILTLFEVFEKGALVVGFGEPIFIGEEKTKILSIGKIGVDSVYYSDKLKEQAVSLLLIPIMRPKDIELLFSTTKKVYRVGETIKLSGDTPVPLTGEIVSELKEEGFKGYAPPPDDLTTSFRVNDENGDISVPSFDGYIVEFEDQSVIEKEKELALKFQKDIKRALTKPAALKIEEKMEKELKEYAEELEENHEKTKNNILGVLGKDGFSNGITGNVISNSDVILLGEYALSFNGVALDITPEEAERLKDIEGIKRVYPDFEVHALLMDSAPLIRANGVWGIQDKKDNFLTGKGVSIAIIDTGVDYSHPDLGECSREVFLAGTCRKVKGGYDFVNKDNDPLDDNGHGTHVAATAAGKGVLLGIAPDADIYALKALNSEGGGSMSKIISAIEWALDPNRDGSFADHVDIISMSLGGPGSPDSPEAIAVNHAVDAGVIVVVAAGNSGEKSHCGDEKQPLCSPGNVEKVITVGAVFKKNYQAFTLECKPKEEHYCGKCGEDGKVLCNYWGAENPKAREVTPFSSRGYFAWKEGVVLKPDVVAPGALICAARFDSILEIGEHPYYAPCIDNKHVQIAGTSMATPIVAGAAALVKQARPEWKPDEIKSALKNTAQNVGDELWVQGSGLIDVFAATQFPLLVAKIDEVNFERDGKLKIKGSAYGERTHVSYNLQISQKCENESCQGDSPAGWTTLFSGQGYKKGEELYLFDIESYPSGFYYLKLEVVDSFRAIAKDYYVIHIQHNFIQSPDFEKYQKVETENRIDIIGRSAGAGFISYNLQHKPISSLVWLPLAQSTQSVPYGVLASLDGTSLNGVYNLQLTTKYLNREEKINSLMVIDRNLKEKWPVKLPTECVSIGKVNICDPIRINVEDIDADGKKEIIANYFIADKGSALLIFDTKGNLQERVELNGESIRATPAIGDINNDGKKEIILATYPMKSGGFGKIYAFQSDGSLLQGFPKQGEGGVWIPSCIALNDLDYDGFKEILVTSGFGFNNPGGELRILDHRGDDFPGWPVPIGIKSGNIVCPAVLKDKSIVVMNQVSSNQVQIEARDFKGEMLKSYLALGDINLKDNNFLPLIVDFEEDGKEELVFINGKRIFVVDSDLNLINSFDVTESGEIPFAFLRYRGEGVLISVKNNANIYSLYARYRDGSVLDGWPVTLNGLPIYGITTGDINGDGVAEVFVYHMTDSSTFNVGVSTLDIGGKVLEGFTKQMSYYTNKDQRAVLTELDANRRVNLITSAGKYIYVWEFPHLYDSSQAYWPEFQHDPEHTGKIIPSFTEKGESISLVMNNEPFEIRGVLVFLLKNDLQTEVIPFYAEPIVLPANSFVTMDGFFNKLEYSIATPGKYALIVEIRDESENVIKTKYGLLRANSQFSVVDK